MGVTDFLLLSCLGFAITAHAQDCSVPDGGPNMHLKDEYILKETFASGDQAAFTCDIGYHSAGGSPSITCTASSWSTVMLKCERNNCGHPGEVENGQIHYPKETLLGDRIEITCNEGYRLVGKSQITCGAQGWMDRLPICEEVECEDLEILNADWISGSRPPHGYKATVEYKCRKGFKMVGQSTLTCEINSIYCEDPHVKHGHLTNGARPSYRPNDEVTFECSSFYIMEGEPTLTCQADGQWSSAHPTCTLNVGAVVGAAIGGVAVAAGAAATGYGVHHWSQQDSRKRLVEENPPNAEEEVALLGAVSLKQSQTSNGQDLGEGHRGQVTRKRGNPVGSK